MVSTTDWHAFLEEFRHFGGRAENVIQRQGPLGLGLFPIDPSQPVELMVPQRLLVPADNVELRNGDAVIRGAGHCPHDEAPEMVNRLLLDRLAVGQTPAG